MKNKKIPSWALMDSTENVDIFVRLVKEYFASINQPIEYDDGRIFRLHLDGSRQDVELGLSNLSQYCQAEQDTQQWPEIIRSHFERFALSEKEAVEFDVIIHDFSAVSSRLVLRLLPNNLDPEELKKTIFREDIPGLHTFIVLETEHAFRYVTPAHVKSWGKREDELFALAKTQTLAAVRRDPQYTVVRDEVAGQGTLQIISSDHASTCTLALMPDELRESVGTYGAYILMPTMHTILVYPINTLVKAVEEDLPKLIERAYELYTSFDFKLTPYPYWYAGSVYTSILWSLNEAEGEGDIYVPELLKHMVEESGNEPTSEGVAIKGVAEAARACLSVYASRETDFNGYWAFDYLLNNQRTNLGIDLLSGTHDQAYAPRCSLFRYFAQHGRDVFAQSVKAHEIRTQDIVSAKMRLLASGTTTDVVLDGKKVPTYPMEISVKVTDRTGAVYFDRTHLMVNALGSTRTQHRARLRDRCIEEFHHLFHSNEGRATRWQYISVVLSLLALLIIILIQVVQFVVGLFV